MKYIFFLLFFSFLLISCGGYKNPVSIISPVNVILTSHSISSSSFSVNIGGILQFTAIGTYSDNSTADLTTAVS